MNPGACTQAAFGQRRPYKPPYPESTPLDLSGWLSSLLARGPIIFRENADFQCTFWHVETVMKKVAVVLGHLKKPLP
jgi:hypothetical protein